MCKRVNLDNANEIWLSNPNCEQRRLVYCRIHCQLNEYNLHWCDSGVSAESKEKSGTANVLCQFFALYAYRGLVAYGITRWWLMESTIEVSFWIETTRSELFSHQNFTSKRNKKSHIANRFLHISWFIILSCAWRFSLHTAAHHPISCEYYLYYKFYLFFLLFFSFYNRRLSANLLKSVLSRIWPLQLITQTKMHEFMILTKERKT